MSIFEPASSGPFSLAFSLFFQNPHPHSFLYNAHRHAKRLGRRAPRCTCLGTNSCVRRITQWTLIPHGLNSPLFRYTGELLLEPARTTGAFSFVTIVPTTSIVLIWSIDKCLTAASNTDGAIVTIQGCTGAAAQKWTFSGGTVKVFGTKCLDVPSGNTADGTKLQIWTCSVNNANQQFSYNKVSHRLSYNFPYHLLIDAHM